MELNRYARHIVLRELGGGGQRKLKEAKVLVIGAGGLGSPALLYLAAAGVGTIGVIDDDSVDGSNLQRQIIHRDQDIDTPKVFSAQAAMQALNPFVTVKPYHRRLTADLAAKLFAEYDLILDGSDNFDTRYLANRAAVATGKPLISGAITQWEGQISLYHPASGAPCFECLFPSRPAEGLAPSCAEAGVIAPLPGIIGSSDGCLNRSRKSHGAGILARSDHAGMIALLRAKTARIDDHYRRPNLCLLRHQLSLSAGRKKRFFIGPRLITFGRLKPQILAQMSEGAAGAVRKTTLALRRGRPKGKGGVDFQHLLPLDMFAQHVSAVRMGQYVQGKANFGRAPALEPPEKRPHRLRRGSWLW